MLAVCCFRPRLAVTSSRSESSLISLWLRLVHAPHMALTNRNTFHIGRRRPLSLTYDVLPCFESVRGAAQCPLHEIFVISERARGLLLLLLQRRRRWWTSRENTASSMGARALDPAGTPLLPPPPGTDTGFGALAYSAHRQRDVATDCRRALKAVLMVMDETSDTGRGESAPPSTDITAGIFFVFDQIRLQSISTNTF